MLNLDSPLNKIPGVGIATLKKLARLKLKTCQDLLWHLPFRYDDFSKLVPIAQAKIGERITIKGKIQQITNRRSWKRRLAITEAIISDQSGSVRAVWFNQPYLTQTLKSGTEIFLAGKLQSTNYGIQLEHPTYELISDLQLHTNRLVPHYTLTSGLTPRLLRQLIAKILPLTKLISDWLPKNIKIKFSLLDINQALIQIHFPSTNKLLLAARRRLAFDELLFLRLKALSYKLNKKSKLAPIINFSNQTKNFVQNLPWQLTQSQRLVAWQIIKDLSKGQPMNRLLQGDVGSGKTVVAGIAALNVLLANYQVVMLTPTEILAAQHFTTLIQLFQNWQQKIALFTNSQKIIGEQNKIHVTNRHQLIKKINKGEIDFLVGTHALLSDEIKIPNLGLLIIDEQHRFGVEQRQKLTLNNNLIPHLLSLSATPIPRSLALTIYGDLDISLLKQLPQGRLPIITKLITPAEKTQAYNLIRQEIKNNHRAYIVCPLIDESDILEVKSVIQEKERLANEIFPDIPIGLLHGQLPAKAKNQAMNDFRQGKTPILVTTSVVEVGVDVPEATIMAIEGAERFGLAQLHQLRGRVGRSTHQSYCLLMTDTNEPTTNKRLTALIKYQNGFDLAEQDLHLRGPGNLLGTIQSGWPALKIASLADSLLIEQVCQASKLILEQDPALKNNILLKEKIQNYNLHPE